MIDVKHLSKSFGDHLVLDDISEHIHPGEKVVVIGPSGSGKSTAMNIIGCLDVPTSGTYHLGGIDVSTMDDDQPPRGASPLTARRSPILRWISTASAGRWAWCSSTLTSFPI